MMYQVIYIPRMEDEICVGEYKTQMEAEQHLKQIKPRLKQFHHIKVVMMTKVYRIGEMIKCFII